MCSLLCWFGKISNGVVGRVPGYSDLDILYFVGVAGLVKVLGFGGFVRSYGFGAHIEYL